MIGGSTTRRDYEKEKPSHLWKRNQRNQRNQKNQRNWKAPKNKPRYLTFTFHQMNRHNRHTEEEAEESWQTTIQRTETERLKRCQQFLRREQRKQKQTHRHIKSTEIGWENDYLRAERFRQEFMALIQASI